MMKRKPNTNLYVNKHSVFLIQYHMVLVTKYRKPVLEGEIGEYVYKTIRESLENKNCHILEMNGEADHIHILLESPPDVSAAEIVKVAKVISARNVRKKYSEQLKKYYLKNVFWADGYFVSTVSENTLENVTRYIHNQAH